VFRTALLVLLCSAAPAAAQTFVVNTTSDAGGPGGIGSGNTGNLRWCIQQANAYGGAATITFTGMAVGAKVLLQGDLPIITNPFGVTIDGGAGRNIGIDAQSASNTTGHRVFFIGVKGSDNTGLTATDSTSHTIANLVIGNGNARSPSPATEPCGSPRRRTPGRASPPSPSAGC
jgi:hypothetical protein